MVTAAVSASTEIAEELLSYFVDIGNKECFAALLYICFDLLRSDVVEELSWQHGLNDFYMPYKIQVQRSLVDKVSYISNIVIPNSYRLCSWHSWRRRSRNDPKRMHRRSKLSQKRQSSIQVIEGSLQTGRWIYLFIVRRCLRMSRIVGQAAPMMAPVRLLTLKSAY
jgi:hypothetical protein